VARATAPAAPNKHQQKTAATRRKLLAAALRIFSRDGFERSRLEDIAKEAGHTRGAFYANFATKEDLFIALLEQQAAKRVAEISQVLSLHEDQPAPYRDIRDFYLNRAKDWQWTMLTLEFKLYALRHSRSRAQLAAAHQRIRESFHIELMSKLKSNRKMSEQAERHARILLEVIWAGLVLEHAYDPKRISAEEVTDLLGRMFDLVVAEGNK
jgi:AcrR family transcriptional regulator